MTRRLFVAAALAVALAPLALILSIAVAHAGDLGFLDNLVDPIAWAISGYLGNPYVLFAGQIVMGASVLVAVTKTPNPSTAWGKAYKVLEFVALVIGKAKDRGRVGLVLAALFGASLLSACSLFSPPSGTSFIAEAGEAVAAAKAKADADAPVAFKWACYGLSYANTAFQVAAPALVAAGKLDLDQIAAEKTYFATLEAICAGSPEDFGSTVATLLAGASAIYKVAQQ